jgi:hypothetical protein
VSERVRIIGDHPWRGVTGTATVERNLGLAGWMVVIETDANQGLDVPDEVFADRDQLRALPKDEDPKH